MPELPEVETVRRSLERRLAGRRLGRLEVHQTALREPVDPRRLRRATEGRRIEGLRRRAKYLVVDLEGGASLLVHLGMSGRFTVAGKGVPRDKHEHLAWTLDEVGGGDQRRHSDAGAAGGERLRFVDPRRFGLVDAVETASLGADPRLAGLGVEPLEAGFDGEALRSAARGRRGPVKAFLMDAGVVVGVGNIYVAEALWQAGVDPRRSVARISKVRWERLAGAVRDVLARAIEVGGTTLRDFLDGDGNPGEFEIALRAYGRDGEPCERCGRRIRRLVQAGRSSYFCPGCQR